MPVPKRKRSRARRDKRFANKGIEETTFATCSNCNRAILPHQACRDCGFYKGSKVFDAKQDRADRRKVKVASSKKAEQAAHPEQE